MADLSSILGSVVSGIIRARMISDEETVRAAESYRGHPLLSGLSIPRARIAEISVDLPLIIEKAPGSSKAATHAERWAAVGRARLEGLAERFDYELPGRFFTSYERSLALLLRALPPDAMKDEDAIRPVFARAFIGAGRIRPRPVLTRDQRDRLWTSLRKNVGFDDGQEADETRDLEVSVLTSEIKEKADPSTVTRIKLTLKEEGLEWFETEDARGTTIRGLVPE